MGVTQASWNGPHIVVETQFPMSIFQVFVRVLQNCVIYLTDIKQSKLQLFIVFRKRRKQQFYPMLEIT